MVNLVVYPLLLGQINKILWSAAISCVCSKQSLTAPDEFLATTMDDVQVCWCCYWEVDPDVSEAYLMELFLQIFSGRNLRWLHSSVNLRNIFSPSELSNNVGYCCFDSSLVRVLYCRFTPLQSVKQSFVHLQELTFSPVLFIPHDIGFVPVSVTVPWITKSLPCRCFVLQH